MSAYHLVMLSLAARACIKAGLRRSDAALEFMAAYDAERERPERTVPGPVLKEAIEPIAVTRGGSIVCGPGIKSMRPPPEEPIK